MCNAEQESLVFIDIDTLTINQTALQQLRLLQSQVLMVVLIFFDISHRPPFLDGLILGRNDL